NRHEMVFRRGVHEESNHRKAWLLRPFVLSGRPRQMFSHPLDPEGYHPGNRCKAEHRRPGGEPGRHESDLSHGEGDPVADEEEKAEPDPGGEQNPDAAAATEARGERYAYRDHQKRGHERAQALVPPGFIDPNGPDAEA